jgi:integrase
MDDQNVIEAGRQLGCAIFHDAYRGNRKVRQSCATWSCRYTDKERGKRIYKGGFATAREALLWYIAQTQEVRPRSDLPMAAGPTCAEWFDAWLAVKKRTISFNCYRPYETHVRLYLKPSFATMLLAELDSATIATAADTWLVGARNDKQRGTLSARTVASILATLTTALHDACARKLISENPASDVLRPRIEQREPLALPLDVAREYIAAMEDEGDVGVATIFAICSGWRRSEVLALRVGQVDLQRGRVRMIGALERVQKDDGTFETRQKEPKSAKSRRSQWLPSLCVNVLRRHYRAVAERRLAEGRGRVSESDLVFEDERRSGHAITPNTFSGRFRRLVARLELRAYRFHDLRRTFAVLMLEEGVGIDQVSRALGHADLRVTTNRYTGVVDSLQKDAAERLDAVLRYGRPTGDGRRGA